MPTDTDRRIYLRNADLREEIVYAVGGDPTRYADGADRGLTKADVRRIAEQLRPADDSHDLDAMALAELYDLVCEWAGGEYDGTAGNQWRVNRPNLKRIHRAVGGRSPVDDPTASAEPTAGGLDADTAVWVRPSADGARKTVHLTRDCPRIPAAPQQKPAGVLGDIAVCAYCRDEAQTGQSEQDWSYQAALKEASQDGE